MTETTTIELTRNEALVLFDFLQREIDLANGKRRLAVGPRHDAIDAARAARFTIPAAGS